MFAFCCDELGFSEDAAYSRILVARAGRRLPAVIEALRSGEIHLAGLRLLVPHLTSENHRQVLAQAANDGLVIGEQRGEHSAGIRIFAGLLLEARQLQKLLQRPGRDGVERASSLGDFVDDFVERLVLALEKLVQLAKVGTYDVPVKAPRLDV